MNKSKLVSRFGSAALAVGLAIGGTVAVGVSSASALGEELGKNCGWPSTTDGSQTVENGYTVSNCESTLNGVKDSAVVKVKTTVAKGGKLRVTATGLKTSTGERSWVALKWDGGDTVYPNSTLSNPVTNDSLPADVMFVEHANPDGTLTANFDIPNGSNNRDGVDWATGSTHTVNLLTGSIAPGDFVRGVRAEFTVN
ncbi:hypothetical protein NQ038_09940 [Brevibacterium sp. 50QC2O2]|uniref:hypothetical protein n=1 Tax=Brevibacterium sp. 50QC2O2 TaxID=2968459 RepID=UPI00211CE893|nr:hypothetical protein [Brevibacterium sp. 50QC2O2]MCQ9388967.1 hypothetical protein [Brevibacterium sp. 50QC2O2]